ncbi:MAG: alpha/beta hydrolase [Spirochaetes bacterium]|nr:alpha/beta hydrolase [Spirochaetota bacterium]
MSIFLPHYKKGFIALPDGAQVPYVIVGNGPRKRVVLPGAGDGLSMVSSAAPNLAFHFRRQAKRYRILLLSRRHPLPLGHSFSQQAADTVYAMERLGFGGSILECNSAGGPIGQCIAVSRPDLVAGLVLSVTLHRSNPHTSKVVSDWLTMIHENKGSELLWNTMELSFRPKTLARYRMLKPLLPLMLPAAKNFERLQHLLLELLDFDHSSLLGQISCPTLVSGGEDDRIVPAAIQREMAALIPGAELQLFPGYGHGNDQENPEYLKSLDRFAEQLPRV